MKSSEQQALQGLLVLRTTLQSHCDLDCDAH